MSRSPGPGTSDDETVLLLHACHPTPPDATVIDVEGHTGEVEPDRPTWDTALAAEGWTSPVRAGAA